PGRLLIARLALGPRFATRGAAFSRIGLALVTPAIAAVLTAVAVAPLIAAVARFATRLADFPEFAGAYRRRRNCGFGTEPAQHLRKPSAVGARSGADDQRHRRRRDGR